MENVFRMIYYSIGAILFVGAISILLYCDNILDKEYDYILHENKYAEVNIK